MTCHCLKVTSTKSWSLEELQGHCRAKEEKQISHHRSKAWWESETRFRRDGAQSAGEESSRQGGRRTSLGSWMGPQQALPMPGPKHIKPGQESQWGGKAERGKETSRSDSPCQKPRNQPVCQSFQLERQRTHIGQHMLEKEEQRRRTHSSRFQNLLQSDSNQNSVVLAQGQTDPYLTPYKKKKINSK